jgi:PAS domain S-box-containing protein
LNKFSVDLFKFPFLRNILILFLAFAILIPIYEHLRTFPAFRTLLTNTAEDQAIRVATHLSSYVFFKKSTLQNPESIPKEWIKEVTMVAQDLKLEKVKVFSKSGRVIFSTDPKDIGIINKHRYYRDIVATGRIFTKMVEKNSSSMEGRTISKSVVETYVPIMRDGKFIGSFEIYYNVSSQQLIQSGLLNDFYFDIVIMAVCLSILAMVLVSRAAVEIEKREAAQESVRAGEERHSAIINTSLDAIITINKNGEIIEFNPAAETLFGYSSKDVVGRDISEKIIPHKFRKKHKDGLAHLNVSHFHNFVNKRLELPAQRSNGEIFDTEIVITPIILQGEQLFTAFLHDITERKLMLKTIEDAVVAVEKTNIQLNTEIAERKLSNQELEVANRALESFVYTVAHDFRTHLRGINTFSNILMNNY